MKQKLPADAVVYVHHMRRVAESEAPVTKHYAKTMGWTLLGKGGMTLVQVEFADGSVARGVALCSPRDNYNKSLGRLIATNRALNSILPDYELREQQYPRTAEEALEVTSS